MVRPRAELEIARPEQAGALAALLEEHAGSLRPVGREEILRLSPILRPEIDWQGAINEATADID
ncbi:MAG TPA: hypothetical protein VF495_03675, partial [Phenylobacterium sp.]